MPENDHKYHKPSQEGIDKVSRIRKAIIEVDKLFCELLAEDSHELDVALDRLNEARMWAIMGVVLDSPIVQD